jgi:threonine synthase
MSYFSHLECSVPCGEPALDPRERHFLCRCGAPLLARYDLSRARSWSRDSLNGRQPNMWRYRELLPLFDGEEPVTLGEGFTPLLHARTLGATVGLDRLYIKDESLNPTNSFKARGQSAAVTRARYLGAETIALPTAGNAGNAAAAYAAAAGLACEVFIPKDAKRPFVDECRLYGAHVTLVDGLITDAGRLAADRGKLLGWYDVSTLKEPYRIEGKKTMAYELAEQMDWRWPDWIVYPTGGGTGMVGMWKAFDEIEQLGWVRPGKRPRMVSVQAEHCAPIVRAFHEGSEKAGVWENARTIADGLRVPRAIGDFLILRAVRESGGTAVAVSDRTMVDGMLTIGKHAGVSAAPEGGAAFEAIRHLTAAGTIKPHESVVLFNTGGALKYLDVLAAD